MYRSQCRWIASAFSGLALMSIIFAKNPRGLLPSSDVAEATEGYMRYRRAYNSDLAVNKKLMGLNLCIVFFQLWNKCPTTIDRLVSMGLGRWPLAVSSQTEGSSVGTFAARLYVSCAVFFHACCCKSHVANWLCCGLSLGSLTICQCMATPVIISAFWTRIW